MGRGELEYRSLDVAGVRRGYWLARGLNAAGPLLMVLHGSGISGKDVATTFSGLATRARRPG
jgi:poly(3-hydroxybutyrate) depolymerase